MRCNPSEPLACILRSQAGMKALVIIGCMCVTSVGCGTHDRGADAPSATQRAVVPQQAVGDQIPGDDPVAVAFADVARHPGKYIGALVQAEARVAEVVSHRAFWLESDGGRVLGVVRQDGSQHADIDVYIGQRLRFEAVVLPPSQRDLAGPSEPAVAQALGSQPAFLAMYWNGIEIVNAAR